MLSEPTLTATGARVRPWDEQMSEQTARRASMPASLLNEKPHSLLDGSRTCSLRKHPVPPRATG